MKTASFKIRTDEIPHYLKAAELLGLDLDFSDTETGTTQCAVLFTIDDQLTNLCFMAGVYCGLYDVKEII